MELPLLLLLLLLLFRIQGCSDFELMDVDVDVVLSLVVTVAFSVDVTLTDFSLAAIVVSQQYVSLNDHEHASVWFWLLTIYSFLPCPLRLLACYGIY